MTDTPVPDLAADIESDRRLETRYAVHWATVLSWTTERGPATARGETLDVAYSGMRVAAEHNFTVGQKVACRVTVHPWHGNSRMFEVDMTAKVIHSNYSSAKGGFDVGLEFLEFDGDGKARFASLVQSLQQGVSSAGAKIIHGDR